jgi:hypothetical protein
VDLNEQNPVRVKAKGGAVQVTLRANEIATLRIARRTDHRFIAETREVTTRGFKEPKDPEEAAGVPAKPLRPAGGAEAAAEP